MIKQKMNQQYDDIVAEKGKQTDDLQKYEDAAERETREIRTQFDANKDKVVALLTESIMNVNLSLPKVVVGNFEETLE